MSRNRMTLLQIVQNTLTAMGSDNVGSLTETVESTSVTEFAKQTYYELMARDEWPHLVQQIKLDALADLSKPNYLRIPTQVSRIDNFRYEVTQDGDPTRFIRELCFLNKQTFLDMIYERNTSDTNLQLVNDFSGIELWITNDTPPLYWTTFDDEYVVTDSYDKDVDDTLQSSKSLVTAKVIPDWEDDGSFVPDMPDQMFEVYLAEVISACFLYIKQIPSNKDEQRSRRGISKLRRQAYKVDSIDHKVRHGRRLRSSVNTTMNGIRGSINAQQTSF